VTDANLLLGYLNPGDFCGGRMHLNSAGVGDAITEHVARPLGLDLTHAASGIYRLVNANMANAIRRISAQRGVDPRGLSMVAYGGNGPVHATAQAEELGITTVIVPKTAPAFSALGLLLSDHLIDEIRAYISPAGRADPERMTALFADMEAAAHRTLEQRSGTHRRVEIRRYLNLCYPGQTFDMAVPIAAGNGRFDRRRLAATIERFHELHEQLHTGTVWRRRPARGRAVRRRQHGLRRRLPGLSAGVLRRRLHPSWGRAV
jgi:N-methylhydantoinase A